MDYLKITYRNSCDIGGSVFAAPETAFKYTMFLDYDVKEGTYELIEEGRENGNKDFVPDFKKLQKKYSIGMVVSEYTYDALCHIPLHDTVYIKTKELETSRVFNFAVQLNEWAKGGAAHITITFTVDYVINSGCCNNESIKYTRCITCNTGVKVTDWIANTDTIFTAPFSAGITDNTFYVVGHLIGGILKYNVLYRFGLQMDISVTPPMPIYGWSVYQGHYNESVCFTKSGITYKFYFDGHYWQPYQLMKSVTEATGIITAKGYCLPDTWVQLYIKDGGGAWVATGQVTDGNIFSTLGIGVSGLVSGHSYQFRFYLYNNNCLYGYSNALTIVKI